ncbi:MAG: autotransporter outer membrane beta-barrel domain-containing protein, partial [Methylobacteriaceae bacterium]|nr:autotransporter outer membrane beta-barrel domain-containing protein [Methylobacteriaceae bacterium]
MSGTAAPLRTALRFALMSSVVLGLAAQEASAQTTVYWTGAAGTSDIFDPGNWSEPVSPADYTQDRFIINSLTDISVTGSPYQDVSIRLHGIGVAPGGTVHVSLSNIYSIDPRFNNEDGQKLVVGANGGTGILDIDARNPDPQYRNDAQHDRSFYLYSGMNVGIGAGSNGTVNFLANPQRDPSLGLTASAPYVSAGSSILNERSSTPDYSIIGGDGGTGTVNFDGLSFVPAGAGATEPVVLLVGTGAGSNGTLNMMNGAKLGIVSNAQALKNHVDETGAWDPIDRVQIGVNGGAGTMTLDHANMLVADGLMVGVGAGSRGTVNLLNGSKGYTYIAYNEYHCPPGVAECADNGRLDSNNTAALAVVSGQLSPKVGVDGGAGTVNIMGENTHWWVSGIASPSPGSLYNAVYPGELYLGHSGTGTMNLGNKGEINLGSGKESAIREGGFTYYRVDPDTYPNDGTLYIAHEANSRGTLNIGDAPERTPIGPGTIKAAKVVFGDGTGAVNFNHTAWDYEFDKYLSDGIYGTGTLAAYAGRTLFNRDHPGFTGSFVMHGGALQINGDFSANQATVFTGGTLEGVGTIGSVTNSGVISPGMETVTSGGTPTEFGTLTIKGSYTANGGALMVNTKLGDDASPTDLLHVVGNTSGNTTLYVVNTGGAGALTAGDGIMVVEVDGASNGKFSLAGDYVTPRGNQAVVAGAYAYTLQKDGLSGSNGNWYLRSEDCPASGCVNPTLPGNPIGGGDSISGSGSGGSKGPLLFQPFAPVAEAYSANMAHVVMDMETFRQRIGGHYDMMSSMGMEMNMTTGGVPTTTGAIVSSQGSGIAP